MWFYLDLWFKRIHFSKVFKNVQDGGKPILTDLMDPRGKFFQHVERRLHSISRSNVAVDMSV